MASLGNRGRLRIGFGFVLILAAFAAYSPLAGNGFVTMGDPAYLTDNPHIRSLDPVSLFKLLFLFHQSNWHPLTLLAQRDAVEYIQIDLVSHLINAAYSLVAYPWKGLQPIGLSPFYPFPAWILERSPLIWLPIVLVGAATAFALWRAVRLQDWSWLAHRLHYVITLAPTIGIIKVGGQAFADRYTYLPLIGCYLLAGQGVQRLWNGVGIAWGVALSLLLVALTWQQTQVWRDDKSLWFTVAYYYPGEVDIAYINLGVALSSATRPNAGPTIPASP